MSSKFRDGFLRLLKLNKFKKLQRYHKGDNVKRKDTFNTTSTNYSSSQHTTDSFWRRYSNRNASQKSPQKINAALNGVARKTSQNNGNQVKKPVIVSGKVSEIVTVQNNRRNSMRFVSDVILIPKEDKVNNEARNANLNSYLDKNYDEIDREIVSEVVVIENVENLDTIHESSTFENDGEDENLQNKSVDSTYCKDAIVIEGLGSNEKKSHFVRVPLLISKNSTSTISKNGVSQFPKESFV